MARGNQRDKAREKNLKEQAGKKGKTTVSPPKRPKRHSTGARLRHEARADSVIDVRYRVPESKGGRCSHYA
jgi:hypothetical protein